jgi:hypothetical protein
MDAARNRIKALVSRRNDIAHGKAMTVKSIDEYSEYENSTFLVMHDLAVQVVEILEPKLSDSSGQKPWISVVLRRNHGVSEVADPGAGGSLTE